LDQNGRAYLQKHGYPWRLRGTKWDTMRWIACENLAQIRHRNIWSSQYLVLQDAI
jgi:hypothetical protein